MTVTCTVLTQSPVPRCTARLPVTVNVGQGISGGRGGGGSNGISTTGQSKIGGGASSIRQSSMNEKSSAGSEGKSQ